MTTAERVNHLEEMLGRILVLEERSLEIHADTRRLLARQQAQLDKQLEDSKKFHALIDRIYQKNGWNADEDVV